MERVSVQVGSVAGSYRKAAGPRGNSKGAGRKRRSQWAEKGWLQLFPVSRCLCSWLPPGLWIFLASLSWARWSLMHPVSSPTTSHSPPERAGSPDQGAGRKDTHELEVLLLGDLGETLNVPREGFLPLSPKRLPNICLLDLLENQRPYTAMSQL